MVNLRRNDMKKFSLRSLPPSASYLLGALIAVPLLIVLIVGLAIQSSRTTPSPPITDTILTKIDGTTGKLSDFNGQVRLLNFWASWCGTCREEMPDLVILKNDYKGKSFSVVSINFGEDSATATQFATSYGANFPIFLDPGKRVASSYGVVTMPTSLLLDKNGKVVKTWVGQISPAEVKQEVNKLLQ